MYIHVGLIFRKSAQIRTFQTPRCLIRYLRRNHSRIKVIVRIWMSEKWIRERIN